MFDIVYVTYNSEKWIEKCFASWLAVETDLKKINIFVVDNASTDNTVSLLKTFQQKNGERFGSFSITLLKAPSTSGTLLSV